MQHSDRLGKLLDQTLIAFDSVARKVIEQDPSWQEIPSLLSVDERRVFAAFIRHAPHS